MPSYFDSFGPVPALSRHAWRRLQERGMTITALHSALGMEPEAGTTPGTVIYKGGQIAAVVNGTTGVIITIWWTT